MTGAKTMAWKLRTFFSCTEARANAVKACSDTAQRDKKDRRFPFYDKYDRGEFFKAFL